jgi:hypothetical protein
MMSELHDQQSFRLSAWVLAVPFGIAGLLGALGCGGSQKAAPQTAATAGAPNVQAPPPIDRSRCKATGKQVMEADTNLDKKPDVWKYFVANGQGAQVMTCKQVDLNHDGKVDIIYYYDDTGAQSNLEEFDLDFDGRIDLTVYYSNGKKIREELDTNYDGQSDLWKFYEDEKLVRIERDSDYNARVDQWEFYEGGKLDRIGYDTSGSGRVDKWDRAPEGDEASPGGEAASPKAASPAPPAPAPATAAATATSTSPPAVAPAKK